MNEEAGAVKLIPQEHLTAFLQHPVTAALYLREWRLPFFKENSLDDCLGMIGDLKAVSAELHQDLEWLASRLSGSTSQPPDTQQTWAEKSDELVVVAHSKTPMKAITSKKLTPCLAMLLPPKGSALGFKILLPLWTTHK